MKKMEIIGYAIIIAIITVWLSLPAKNQETKKELKIHLTIENGKPIFQAEYEPE